MSKRTVQPIYPALDYRRLIQDVGGPTRMAKMLAQLGMTVPHGTVSKWGERNRASSAGVLMLLRLTKSTKPRIDLVDYLI